MSNHGNRSKSSPAKNPKPAAVMTARESVQAKLRLGITDAQAWCAKLLHTKLRTWQQWETGDRRMHPAFWDLFQRRLGEELK